MLTLSGFEKIRLFFIITISNILCPLYFQLKILKIYYFSTMIIINPLSIEYGQIYFEHIFFPTKEKEYRSIFRILKRSKNTDKENIFKITYDIFLNQWNKANLIQ